MENNQYLNKWVVCKNLYYKDEFQEINNLDLVHEDFKDFVLGHRTQTIYKCLGLDNDYLILRSKLFELKVKSAAIEFVLPNPVFEWGMKVKEVVRPEVIGVVEDLLWHQKRQTFLYQISVGDKKKSRQYQSNELVSIK